MTTIVNTPRSGESDSGLGLILGIIIAIALVVLFIVYGLPALRNNQAPAEQPGTNINVTLPSDNSGNTGGADIQPAN